MAPQTVMDGGAASAVTCPVPEQFFSQGFPFRSQIGRVGLLRIEAFPGVGSGGAKVFMEFRNHRQESNEQQEGKFQCKRRKPKFI